MTSKEHADFASRATPVAWYQVAQLLHESATKLYSNRGEIIEYKESGLVTQRRYVINRPVFLLSGFAMENLIKAYLVYENPSYIENGRLHSELKSHGLSGLRLICKKVPSPKRLQFVFEALEKGLTSWARYPCAVREGEDEYELHATPEFWEQYNKAFSLHAKRLEDLLSKKWTGPYGKVTQCKFIQ